MQLNIYIKNICWTLVTLISINFYFIKRPTHAFVPHVYIPNEKLLIETSIGIGLTASEYIKYGETEEAIGLSKLALSLNPEEVELWIILTRAQLNNNNLQEALLSIEKAKEINPKIALIWYTKASIEMQMGRIESAIESIEKSLSLNKNNANGYFLLGNARLIQKNNIIALEAFKKATIVNPKFWQAINNQGLIYFELGKIQKAIRTWRKVLTIKADPEPKLALAVALYSLEENNQESIKLAKEALQENPNYYFQQHQEDQLWGEKLRAGSKELFKNPQLKAVITTASANSSFTNENEQ